MARVNTQFMRSRVKPAVFLLASIPAIWLCTNWWFAYQGQDHALGFNPFETSNRFTGDWALRFLLITLAVTPLIKITKLKSLMLLRRMLGLFAFFYACLHMLSYLWLDLGWDFKALLEDIAKRTYITLGMTGFLMLVPLAITSNRASLKRMGAKVWQKLHRLVYAIGVLGVIHFIMMRKGFQIEPLVYAAILAVMLGMRLKKPNRVSTP